MIPRAALMAVLALVLPTPQAAPESSAGLCIAPEKSFFSCQTSTRKWINLCGAKSSAMQYRFGKPGKIEFQYPPNAAEGLLSLRLSHYARFQVDRFEVSFNNLGSDYAVFDYTEKRQHLAGVRVTTPDGKEREIACVKPISSELGKLQGVLPCDTDNALNGGKCP